MRPGHRDVIIYAVGLDLQPQELPAFWSIPQVVGGDILTFFLCERPTKEVIERPVFLQAEENHHNNNP